jgi:hypothetical protein
VGNSAKKDVQRDGVAVRNLEGVGCVRIIIIGGVNLFRRLSPVPTVRIQSIFKHGAREKAAVTGKLISG